MQGTRLSTVVDDCGASLPLDQWMGAIVGSLFIAKAGGEYCRAT